MIEIDDHLLRAKLAVATSEYVNGLAPDLPPLDWHYDRQELVGQISDVDYPDPKSVAQQWQAALGLVDGGVHVGYRRFLGDNRGVPIEIWYVINRETFEGTHYKP